MAEHAGKPKVRFAGFTEAWEQRKLGEVAKLNNGKDYKHLGDGNIPVYGTGGYMLSVNQALSYKDDAIGIGRKGTIDKPYILKAPFWTVDTLFYSIPNDKTELNFLFATFQKVDWKAADESTGVPSLSKSTIENIITFFPSLPEQARIGAFFCHLDRLITLHQRKRGRLENIKKAMLEKMFPKNGADVPEIRFAGFTEAWEQRKVGNLIEDYVERTTIQNQYPVLTSSQQQGIVLQEAYFADRQVTTNDNVGYFVLPKGYFTYRSRSDTDVFVFNRNDILDKGIISYYYPVFQTKYTCSDFLLRRLNHGIRKQLAMAAEGTGQKVLAHSKFKNMTVSVPKIGEQQKIGTFFRQLDRLITLHQRKVTLLQNIKKACLEKMFV